MHSRGSTARKGRSWPNFWAGSAPSSLVPDAAAELRHFLQARARARRVVRHLERAAVLEFDSYLHRNAYECPVVSHEASARGHHSYAPMAHMHLWLLCTVLSKFEHWEGGQPGSLSVRVLQRDGTAGATSMASVYKYRYSVGIHVGVLWYHHNYACKSVFSDTVVRARRALNHRKRRVPTRADTPPDKRRRGLGRTVASSSTLVFRVSMKHRWKSSMCFVAENAMQTCAPQGSRGQGPRGSI